MNHQHICPFCSSLLLSHIRSGKLYWFCPHCYQEIPYGIENNNYQKTLIIKEEEKKIEGKKNHGVRNSLPPEMRLDKVTKLASRRYFEEYLQSQWERMVKEQEHISLMILALELSKSFQYSGDKELFDKYLKQFANIIVSVAKRPTDLVARYESEKFMVLLPYTHGSVALYLADEIERKFMDLKISSNKHEHQILSYRLGVASVNPNPQLSPESLIQTAFSALSQATIKGDDLVIFYATI